MEAANAAQERLQKKIDELESGVAAKREEAEREARAWRASARVFLEQEYRRHTERAVVEHAEVAQQLGQEALGALKTELRHLVDDLDRIVAEDLDRDELWAHRAAEIDTSWDAKYRYEANRPRGEIDEAVRRAIGRLASLLVDRGLVDRDGTPWRRGTDGYGGHWRYAYGYEWSPQMVDTMQRYAARLREVQELADALRQTRRQQAEDRARALWESA